MNKLQEKCDQLATKRRELHDIFEAAGPDLDMTPEVVEQVKSRNLELDDLAREVEQLRATADIERKNREEMERAERLHRPVSFASGSQDAPQQAQPKTLGELFVESKAYKEYVSGAGRGPADSVDVELKTLFQTSAGFAPQAIRTGQVVFSAQQQPRVVDVIPMGTTTQVSVVYMRETTYTNNAAEASEGGDYGEAALVYTEQTSPVRKIAVFLPTTDEQLADVANMQSTIENRLTLMLRQRLDSQIVVGDGNAPNLTGILNTGSILSQAKGSDPVMDAVYKGIVKARTTGFVEPNAILFHPNDFQDIRLTRTADGIYILGNPGDAGTERLWGLPVVQSTYVTENTAITADFAGYTSLDFKQGIEFEVSNSHSDYFTKGKLAIRASVRAAFTVYRPSAVCKVTGI